MKTDSYVTTTDTCSNCGAKLKNAETSRLEYQGEASRLEKENAELRQQLAAFHAAMEREKKPDWEKSLKDLAATLRYEGTHHIPDLLLHNRTCVEAARQLDYMANSFTLKANFVPSELRIKELEQQLAQAQAACAALRESVETAGHFEAWDSEAQKNYPFRDSLAYRTAIQTDCGKGWHSPQDWECLEAEKSKWFEAAMQNEHFAEKEGWLPPDKATALQVELDRAYAFVPGFAEAERLRSELTLTHERHDRIAAAHKELSALLEQNQAEWKAKVDLLTLRLTRLANEAAVLCVHCDEFKNGGLGAFATAREFTKDEIKLAREALALKGTP